MEDERMVVESQITGGDEQGLMDRRDFLERLGKWSKIVVAATVVGGVVLSADHEAGAWVNHGGGWVNRGGSAGWVNGGGGSGGWVNRGGSAGWVNGGGGSGGWVNRGAGWANRGGSWVNRF